MGASRRVSIIVGFVLAVFAVFFVMMYITKARQVTVRTECSWRLRSIGGGVNDWHAMYGSYPRGTEVNAKLPPERRLSWQLTMLPFVEDASLSSKINRSEPWDAIQNLQYEIYVAEYQCPANRQQTGPSVPGITHYVGIAGVGEDAALLQVSDPRTGIFGYDRTTRQVDIRDGFSTTMMVAETATDNGPWAAGGRATVRGLEQTGLPYLGENGQFSSKHRYRPAVIFNRVTSTNVLFADGSVRCVTDAVSPSIFEAMATIAGHEHVDVTGELLSWRDPNP